MNLYQNFPDEAIENMGGENATSHFLDKISLYQTFLYLSNFQLATTGNSIKFVKSQNIVSWNYFLNFSFCRLSLHAHEIRQAISAKSLDISKEH